MPLSGHLELESARDALTGLATMEGVQKRLREWIDQAASDGSTPSVHALLLGLRRFDAVNLAYGRAAGDAALAEVARRMSHFAAAELDGGRLVARSGGSDFLILANEACSRERWRLFADQLADIVARPIPLASDVVRLSPRMALLRGLADEPLESMLDRLGQAQIAAQRPQARRLVWADGETTRAGRSAAQLDADILTAIDKDEIEILYQPQFALGDDRLSGAEALARWNHPKLGRIGAGALFSIAERSDHMAQLSRHIAEKAMLGARHWPEGVRLSLNVTPWDLAEAGYADGLLNCARQCEFALDRLTLEVTEQALLGDIQLAGNGLRQLADQGVRIALDDFGAGFCNFRYLKLLPLHYLKLDRSMVEGILDDPRDLAVLKAIIAMAKALDLDVIAEGIETLPQRAAIAAEGCQFYQGFLKAQPMSAAEFAGFAKG